MKKKTKRKVKGHVCRSTKLTLGQDIKAIIELPTTIGEKVPVQVFFGFDVVVTLKRMTYLDGVDIMDELPNHVLEKTMGSIIFDSLSGSKAEAIIPDASVFSGEEAEHRCDHHHHHEGH